MRPTPDYRLKCVTVVTPESTSGGGFTKNHGSAWQEVLPRPHLQGYGQFCCPWKAVSRCDICRALARRTIENCIQHWWTSQIKCCSTDNFLTESSTSSTRVCTRLEVFKKSGRNQKHGECHRWSIEIPWGLLKIPVSSLKSACHFNDKIIEIPWGLLIDRNLPQWNSKGRCRLLEEASEKNTVQRLQQQTTPVAGPWFF